MTTIASMNGAETISGRIKNVGLSNFFYYFREQKKNTNIHPNETVNFIAWQPGKGTIGPLQFEAATTANAGTNNWYSGTFKSTFGQAPLLLADIQTTNNTDTSALRTQLSTTTDFKVKVEEEQFAGRDVTHPSETVGYLSITPAEN